MKVIIQIPAYNEESCLAQALQELPKTLKGIECVEWLVIDDGSQDKTLEVAKQNGAHHVISNTGNLGLAKTFMVGLEHALELGADIVVNTDADNQYQAKDIQKLIDPILAKDADIVIGTRPIQEIPHFSYLKKKLQFLGSWVVRKLSKTTIEDAPSGFRAISREAALKLNIFSAYTYTVEMILQASTKGIAICSVPVRVNADKRPSKLVKNIFSYIRKSMLTMFRIFITYHPFRVFFILGFLVFGLGFLLGLRWIVLFMGKGAAQHIPSLILASILLLGGLQLCVFGLVADLIAVNRQLLENIQQKVRKQHFKHKEQA